jgi:RNA polymerase sigma factor (sigma-70 family)
MGNCDMVHDQQAVLARPSTVSSSAGTAPGITGRARLIEWFERWRRPIRSWIAADKGVHAGDIDDLTQEVFLRLLRYSDDVLVENPQGYLYRIASNVVQEWRQRCRVRLPHEECWLEELQLDTAQEPEDVFVRASATRYLQAAVDQLPARQREILRLHVEEGLTYKQIAQLRGLTYRIVLRDLTRAYTTLRKRCLAEDLR